MRIPLTFHEKLPAFLIERQGLSEKPDSPKRLDIHTTKAWAFRAERISKKIFCGLQVYHYLCTYKNKKDP